MAPPGKAATGEGVLKVGREEVVLVGRQGADFALEELHVGQGAARPVVGEAAMGHGRPVAQRGHQQHGVLAAAADQLLYRLRAIEEAGRGFGNDGQAAFFVGDERIALIVHGRVQLHVVVLQQFFGAGGVRTQQQQGRHAV